MCNDDDDNDDDDVDDNFAEEEEEVKGVRTAAEKKLREARDLAFDVQLFTLDRASDKELSNRRDIAKVMVMDI
jgi:hypothetical protein